jgi:hypothetical protein
MLEEACTHLFRVGFDSSFFVKFVHSQLPFLSLPCAQKPM